MIFVHCNEVVEWIARTSAGTWIERARLPCQPLKGSKCCTRGESEDHTREKACRKGIHHGFETQGRHHQKSKTGVLVAPRKGLMQAKKSFLKNSSLPCFLWEKLRIKMLYLNKTYLHTIIQGFWANMGWFDVRGHHIMDGPLWMC